MITVDQAMLENRFHYPINDKKCALWRRNGMTKRWKRNHNRFSIPVKFGLYDYGYITDENSREFHLPHECPVEMGVNI